MGNAEKLEKKEVENGDGDESSSPPLISLNHVSRLCRDVKKSEEFYRKVLGMVPIERPQALDHFDGAWLFNYGVGIHLVQSDHANDNKGLLGDPDRLDPMDNHISFQCADMEMIEGRLKELGIKYIKRTMEDDVTNIDQLFFNDPDGFMIEICNCENRKLTIPAGSGADIKLPSGHHNPPLDLNAKN